MNGLCGNLRRSSSVSLSLSRDLFLVNYWPEILHVPRVGNTLLTWFSFNRIQVIGCESSDHFGGRLNEEIRKSWGDESDLWTGDLHNDTHFRVLQRITYWQGLPYIIRPFHSILAFHFDHFLGPDFNKIVNR